MGTEGVTANAKDQAAIRSTCQGERKFHASASSLVRHRAESCRCPWKSGYRPHLTGIRLNRSIADCRPLRLRVGQRPSYCVTDCSSFLMSEEPVMDQPIPAAVRREPWNKGKLVGQKAPLKLKDIWAIRVRLQLYD